MKITVLGVSILTVIGCVLLLVYFSFGYGEYRQEQEYLQGLDDVAREESEVTDFGTFSHTGPLIESLTVQPTDVAFELERNVDGKMEEVVRLRADGSIEFGPSFTKDEASWLFWLEISKYMKDKGPCKDIE